MPTDWPKTIPTAVDFILSKMSEETKTTIRNTPRDRLIAEFHFQPGMQIRNMLGLWSGNFELMKACGQKVGPYVPDSASSVIIDALWERLQTTTPDRKD